MTKKTNHRLRYFLFLFISGLFAGCSMPIQHGLTEREANQIVVLFSKAQPPIDATKMKDESGREVRWNISVSKSDAPRAIALLQSHNLPRQKEKGLKEVYSQTGMIPTESQERARLMMAISGDLNQTLKMINGVLKARVHVSIPKEKSILRPGEKAPEPKASVLLIVQSNLFKTLGSQKKLKRETQKLVMGSIAKIKQNNVNVVVVMGDSSPAMQGSTAGTAIRKVLFVKVVSSDAMKLRAVMFGGFGLIGLLLVICLLLFFRASSLKQQMNAGL